MKEITCLLAFALASAVSLHAVTWEFDLTGPGGPGATGGSEVPADSNPGVATENPPDTLVYNTDTQQLSVHLTYENFNTGSVGIHGPATTTETAPLLYTLDFNQVDDSSGFVDDTITLQNNPMSSGFDIPTQESQLSAGTWYIEFTTPSPGGNIRGQLTPVPEPQQYAMVAGIALLGFAGYRRFKTHPAV